MNLRHSRSLFGESCVTLGTGSTIQNSQCILNPAASSVSGSGNTLTINLALTFQAGFTGAKNLYIDLTDRASGTTGLTQSGTWTVAANQPPTNVSVTPASGSGGTQTFAFTASSPGGYSYIAAYLMLFNWEVTGVDGCYLYYDHTGNLLYLSNDAGGLWGTGIAPGTAGTLSNSWCSVNTGTASVLGSGNNLTVNVPVTFAASNVGPQSVYLYSIDNGGLTVNYQQMGTWTGHAAAPGLPSVSSSCRLQGAE